MRAGKRLLSFLLCVLMVFSMISTSAMTAMATDADGEQKTTVTETNENTETVDKDDLNEDPSDSVTEEAQQAETENVDASEDMEDDAEEREEKEPKGDAPGTRQLLTFEDLGGFSYVYHAVENGVTLTLYCFNSQLLWPVSGDIYSEYYVPDNMLHLSEYVKDKVYRIFYAGYPHNNIGLYSEEEAPEIPSVAELDEACDPPEALKELMPDVNWSELNFTAESLLYMETSPDRPAVSVTEEAEVMDRIIDLMFDEPYMSAAYSKPSFYYLANAYIYGPYLTLEELQMVYAYMLPTVDAASAHDATQLAIWRILYENGVPNNGKDQADAMMTNQLVRDLVDFANGVGPYADAYIPPRGTTINDMQSYVPVFESGATLLKADGTPVGEGPILFRQQPNGSFLSEPLHFSDNTYALPYTISLVGNDGVISTVTNHGSGEIILFSDYEPDYAEISVETANMFPSDVYQYVRENQADIPADQLSHDAGNIQDMSGCYYQSVPMSFAISTEFIELGKLTASVTKDWDDADNQDGIRPQTITVNLLADGTVVDSAVLSEDNNWSHTFINLDQYNTETEQEIVYTVEEVEVPEYESVISGNITDGFVIKNTYEPRKTSVAVSKEWLDHDDQDGIRPESVTVCLLADGQETDETLILNANNNWTGTFENLPAIHAGTEITYTVEEIEVDGYTAEVSGNAAHGYVIQNTHEPEETSISVSKQWDDAEDQDGLRPTYIAVSLFANGNDTGETILLDNANNWFGSFTNLPKYENGEPINYSVQEDAIDGYTGLISSGTEDGEFLIVNSHTPSTITIPVEKVWDDSNDQDSKRPDSISVVLIENEENEVDTLLLNENNDWAGEFTDLPEYKDGKKIEYTIEEVAVEEYHSQITGSAEDGFVITNTYTPGMVEIPVTKLWHDNDNQDGLRPDVITVKLYADDVDTGKFLELTANSNWAGKFENLAEYDNGSKIAYTVEEVLSGNNVYTTQITGSAGEGYIITNTYEPSVIDIPVTKIWEDADDQDGKRPDEIIITLVADGELTGETLELNESNDWSDEFTDLPEYKDGNKIVYTIEEIGVKEYDSEITGSADSADGFIVTNTYTPGKVEVPVTKIWDDKHDQDGKRPQSIVVKLFADGVDTGMVLELNAANNWEGKFADLDEYKEGNEIVYTIKEDTVAEYYTEVSGAADTGYVITNTYIPGKVEVPVEKLWNDSDNQDGIRPQYITVVLVADDVETNHKLLLSEENGWSGAFVNLDEFKEGAVGVPVVYTVKEESVSGYTPDITGSASEGFVITNTHDVTKTSIDVKKTWHDNDNQDGIRPDSITVVLLANGVEAATFDLSADNNWTGNFANLDEFKEGHRINYTVQEVEVTGYTGTISGNTEDGFVLTNTHEAEKVSIHVTKTWDDAHNQDGVRPESVSFRLIADGIETETILTITARMGWKASFENLDKFKDGAEIVYTVREIDVDEENYDSAVSGDAVNGFVFTNTHEPSKISIPVEKVWDDANDQDGKRPESVSVVLIANAGDVVDTVVLNEDNDWESVFTDIPEYKNGEKIVYTIQEVAVSEYHSEISGSAEDGFTVTNSYTPGTVEVPVTKLWHDEDNQDGKRPDSITIKLYADNADTGNELVLSENNNWSGKFENLPEYKAGSKITYSIVEVTEGLNGYTGEITGNAEEGFVVTNSYTPSVVEIPVTKVWNDANNQDGKRPEFVNVLLLADDVATEETLTLNESNGWSAKFENLPEYKAGNKITYTVIELTDGLDGYTGETSGNASEGFVITNSHTPSKIDIPVTKVWNDLDNEHGKRPASIVVTLLADNAATGKTLELSQRNSWTGKFENLPEYKDGKQIVYTITEVGVKDYESKITGNVKDGFTVTNTYIQSKVEISVKKVWNDNNNSAKARPEKIQVVLVADGKDTKQKLELSAANNWSGSFKNLDELNKGKAIKYTVREVEVKNYTASISGSAEKGYTITNTYKTSDNNNNNGNTTTPDTGDHRNLMLWGILLAISCCGIIGVIVFGRKRKHNK